jgi:eukaryotic-like serine/threonine-protein kinase
LLAKNSVAAIAEFQRMLHRGLLFNNPEGALARLGLARGYALGGNKAIAGAKYQEFLELWKGAVSDIPILNEGHSEYARLNVSFR